MEMGAGRKAAVAGVADYLSPFDYITSLNALQRQMSIQRGQIVIMANNDVFAITSPITIAILVAQGNYFAVISG